MFWSNRTAELVKKHQFIADFIGLDQSTIRGGWAESEELAKNLKMFIKKIDAPSMNINFERSLGSNYVHYFQQGELHWEPINITFVDAIEINQTNGIVENAKNLKRMFMDYLKQYTIVENNRTGLVELPVFCTSIKIASIQDYAKPQDTRIKKENIPKTNTHEIDKNGFYEAATNRFGFVITNPRITKISFGTYDYSADDVNEISITVVPEWCELTDVEETDDYNNVANTLKDYNNKIKKLIT